MMLMRAKSKPSALQQWWARLSKAPQQARRVQAVQGPKPFSIALTGFKPLRMAKMHEQQDALDYTAWLLAVAQANRSAAGSSSVAEQLFQVYRERVARYGVAPEAIAQRQLWTFPERCIPGPSDSPPALPRLFSSEAGRFEPPDLRERMQHFGKLALDCFDQLYAGEEQAPDDIIHVTCSGYLSPSPAQRYVSKRAWLDTAVTHSYHMGCYGAFPPVQMASGFLAASHCSLPHAKTRVDVVHTELLSMHADFGSTDPGSIVNMTLFADGFVRYSVAPSRLLQERGQTGLAILAADNRIIGDTVEEMAWTPRGDVFEMYLSKAVPAAIRDQVLPFSRSLCAQAGVSFDDAKADMYFAIHPGGPKILDHVRDALGIDESRVHWCRTVLRENGNMSSATIPHIWHRLLEDEQVPTGARILTMAFGPGLTAAGMLLQKL